MPQYVEGNTIEAAIITIFRLPYLIAIMLRRIQIYANIQLNRIYCAVCRD